MGHLGLIMAMLIKVNYNREQKTIAQSCAVTHSHLLTFQQRMYLKVIAGGIFVQLKLKARSLGLMQKETQ